LDFANLVFYIQNRRVSEIGSASAIWSAVMVNQSVGYIEESI